MNKNTNLICLAPKPTPNKLKRDNPSSKLRKTLPHKKYPESPLRSPLASSNKSKNAEPDLEKLPSERSKNSKNPLSLSFKGPLSKEESAQLLTSLPHPTTLNSTKPTDQKHSDSSQKRYKPFRRQFKQQSFNYTKMHTSARCTPRE